MQLHQMDLFAALGNPVHGGALFSATQEGAARTRRKDVYKRQSQIFFTISNQYISAAVGFCALAAIIRAFRGEKKVGNFFIDMWRVLIYLSLIHIFKRRAFRHNADDMFALDVIETCRWGSGRAWVVIKQVRQILRCHNLARAQNDRALDDIAQLTDISWPSITHQCR